ncbi:hypothetical protein AAG906_000449 [Vitis piasezkii]
MSTQVSECPLVQIPKPENCPRAKFHPNIWVTYSLPTLRKMRSERGGEKELMAAAGNPSQLLNFIDAVQRLGVAYHFEREIEESLQHIYDRFHDADDTNDDLYNIGTIFHVVRDQRINYHCISIFNKFKDEKNILEEALAFTTTHLKATVESLGYPLAEQVAHALKRPIRKGLERLEARWYISIYQDEAFHDKTLLKLAKLDFNLVQSLHKEELSNLARWDINSIDHLPEYMKLFYVALLDVYNEIEEEMEKERHQYRVHYAIDAMKNQVRAYFAEAKWFHEQHIPTMEEYMRVALLSSGYSLLATSSFIGMGEIVSKEAFDWVISDPKIIRASTVIAREFHNQIVNAWMDINQECLKPTAVPMPLLTRVLNLSRVIYKEESDEG